MNIFVEGLQGSGKTTLVRKLSALYPANTAVEEGAYSPVELAWCAYMDAQTYAEMLDKYSDIRGQLEEKTVSEGNKRIVCYTKIFGQKLDFYEDFAQYEIYNNRVSYEDFKAIVLSRFRAWDSNGMIFECSLFRNIAEDLMLFRCASDDEIIDFYRQIQKALEGKEYRIIYLKTADIKGSLEAVRRERADENGNELWFPLMLGYFEHSPYALAAGLSGEEALIDHFTHRQNLELQICKEIFTGRVTVLASKEYADEELMKK